MLFSISKVVTLHCRAGHFWAAGDHSDYLPPSESSYGHGIPFEKEYFEKAFILSLHHTKTYHPSQLWVSLSAWCPQKEKSALITFYRRLNEWNIIWNKLHKLEFGGLYIAFSQLLRRACRWFETLDCFLKHQSNHNYLLFCINEIPGGVLTSIFFSNKNVEEERYRNCCNL